LPVVLPSAAQVSPWQSNLRSFMFFVLEFAEIFFRNFSNRPPANVREVFFYGKIKKEVGE
jgi:hypothetical protein